jgi:hypothetical protein
MHFQIMKEILMDLVVYQFIYVIMKLYIFQESLTANLCIVNQQFIEYRRWSKLNYNQLYLDLARIDYSDLYSSEKYNSDSFCINISQRISEVFDKNFPKIRKIKNEAKTPWITSEILSIIHQKNY